MHHISDRSFLEIEVVHDGAWKCQKALAVLAENLQAFVALQNLNEARETHCAEDVFRRVASGLPGLDDLRAGYALRKRQTRLHDQWPSQHDDEEHSDQPAYNQHQG